MKLRTWMMGVVASAAMLFAGTASAHELACTETFNDQSVLVVNSYPTTVHALVTVTNVHPTAQSTALDVSAPELEPSGFSMPTPFTLDVGASQTASVDIVINDYPSCIALTNRDNEQDGVLFSTVSVEWDLGSAECTAALVCQPELCVPGGVF